MLREWARLSVRQNDEVIDEDFTFTLREPVLASWVVKHSHPRVLKDPLRIPLTYRSPRNTCAHCAAKENLMMPTKKALLVACDLIEREGDESAACALAFSDLKASGNFDIRREVRIIEEAIRSGDLSTAEKKAKVVWCLAHVRQIAREIKD